MPAADGWTDTAQAPASPDGSAPCLLAFGDDDAEHLAVSSATGASGATAATGATSTG